MCENEISHKARIIMNLSWLFKCNARCIIVQRIHQNACHIGNVTKRVGIEELLTSSTYGLGGESKNDIFILP
jgi:hypothetical protein